MSDRDELISFVKTAMTWFNSYNNDNDDCDFSNGTAQEEAIALEERAALLLTKLRVQP